MKFFYSFLIISLFILSACNMNSFPDEEYNKIVYSERIDETKYTEVSEIEEDLEIKSVIDILDNANWEKKSYEWAEPSDGIITLLSKDEDQNETIDIWFESTSGKVVLYAENYGLGKISYEEGEQLKEILAN